jgi:uncharacterized protein YdeI (YjbR/CyaY-like superfamily)
VSVESLGGAPVIACRDGSERSTWLADHYTLQSGVWLRTAKKGSGLASITSSEALDVALCYGWIDGQRRSLDGEYYLQKYIPRRPKSTWSKVNVERAEALIAAGRMREPGMAAVAAAKADGRWAAAYESPKNATIPPDLAAALEKDERARRCYESLGRTDQHVVILRVTTARTPETRGARLRRMITTLAAGERVR